MKIRLSVKVIFLLLPLVAYAQNDASVQLNQLLSSFQTYQANFHQVTQDTDGRVLQTSQGRIMIKRPGNFRWEADTPTKQIIITDGKTLWVYDVDLAQATRQPLNQQTNVNPASLLSGSVENLKKQFTITGGGNVFQLVPTKKGINFNWIRVEFRGGVLASMKVQNNLDEVSTFQFTNIKINPSLPPSLFQFKPPRGVDVVNQ